MQDYYFTTIKAFVMRGVVISGFSATDKRFENNQPLIITDAYNLSCD